jgi:hypothetical protein
MDVFLVPYENENGMAATKEALGRIKAGAKIGVLIGPEGGFEEKEVALAMEAGGVELTGSGSNQHSVESMSRQRGGNFFKVIHKFILFSFSCRRR